MFKELKVLWPQILFLALTEAAVGLPAIEGHWEGAVTRDGAVQRIAVNFATSAGEVNAPLRATIDIPELGMFDEPMRDVKQEGANVEFRFIYGRFDCVVHADIAEITGINSKWGPPVRIHLKRLASLRVPVQQEEVSFSHGSVTLKGTLVRPKGRHRVPAVVCVHGSDQSTRTAWTYRGMAFVLARSGFASLIFDRRGSGASGGSAKDATFDDLAQDAVAAVEYLKTRHDIRPTQIGMFGASQGGWIGPLAASKSRDIAFVIVQSGPAVSVWEQERHRIEFGMKADGAAPADIAAALALSDQIFEYVSTGEGWNALSSAIQGAKKAEWAKYLQLPEDAEDAMTWRRQRYDPASVLSTLKQPVLLLFGENDTVVPPSKNIPAFKRYLSKAGNDDVTIRVFPDVGHGMELPRSLRGDRWQWPRGYWVWPKKAPGYHEAIVTWVQLHTRASETERD